MITPTKVGQFVTLWKRTKNGRIEPFELVGMDHPAHDLNADTYHEMNPFEQIPVIDDDGVVLSESGAMLIYLVKKSQKMIPSDLAGESQVVRWCFAATNSLEIPLMNIAMIDWFKDEGSRKSRDFLVGWAHRHLSNLERWLEQRESIASDSFTVADILMVHVLAVIKDESLLKQFSNFRSYRDRYLGRPAWQRTIESYNKNVDAG